jgi:hypothetical protein
VTTLAGPLAIAAVLLVAGGVAKVRAPLDTARALQGVGIGATAAVVRVGAAVEVAVGVLALLAGWPVVIALVAVSYLAFAAFVVRARRADAPISSCGCFGKIDTPPSLVHVVLDGAIAIAAGAVAIVGTDVSMPTILPDQPLFGVPFVFLVAVGAGLMLLAFTALPRTLGAVDGAA